MPRRRRQVSRTGMYHVFVRGINKELIFNQSREKNYFKRIIRKHLSKYDIEIYAYCIMSNHAHLMIKSKELLELSMFMSKILAEYAEYYNYKGNRNGHVFQNRFKSEVIEESRYFWTCLKYIHMNPVKAKMVSNVLQYRYSSIHDYKNEKTDIINKKAIQRCRDKFGTWKTFLEYHGVYNEGIFLDTKEEMEFRCQEIAWNILWEMQESEQVENIVEILEEPDLREKYMKKIKQDMKISDNRMKKMYRQIKESLIV